MLKIKKSHCNKSEWIVYNPDNFVLHTHCRSRRVALIIRSNVKNKRMPKTKDFRLLESHLRVTKNKRYRKMIEQRIDELKLERERHGV